jgi:hypothetical protein
MFIELLLLLIVVLNVLLLHLSVVPVPPQAKIKSLALPVAL